ncbi:MAG TPA: hypothetical protein VJR94_05130 [Candidatus Nitrosocosmicus sp.]|nr:hypothetical protein [Candidatus Nitrosocosmicus sp.]
MYVNKVTATVISAMFLLLILSSVNFSSVKLVNAAPGDLVNYNNNFNMYTSPNDPNKDSAMQNADCVVNFMQTYVYAASSADNCNNTSTPATPTEQSQTPMQSQTPYQSQSYPAAAAAPDGPQTGVSGQSDSVGVVKVVDTSNSNGANLAPIQSTSFTTNQNNPNDDNDNDKDARDKDNDDDNDNDKDENKVYNENTVTKEERKLLLTTCFERAYDKGDYLSTEEIVKCAENYNS